nr:hypothetical protein [Tanacetum cinerariifolium]
AWVLMGDFGSALFIEDTYYGSPKMNILMREFSECVEKVEVSDVNSAGLHYSWTQKPKVDMGILKKIDRVMGNISFSNEYPGSVVRLRNELEEVHNALDKNPSSATLHEEESIYLKAVGHF